MGKLFIFEGADGCGKTTQIKLLANFLESKGYKVKITREPGGTPLGEELRNILLKSDYITSKETQAYLFATSRRDHSEQIKKWIEEGYIVLCDRNFISSFVYQGNNSTVYEINKCALEPIKNIDCIIFYFSITVDTMIKRITNRNEKIDNMEKQYQHFEEKIKLLQQYDAVIKNCYQFFNKQKTITIDANKNIDEIQCDLIKNI